MTWPKAIAVPGARGKEALQASRQSDVVKHTPPPPSLVNTNRPISEDSHGLRLKARWPLFRDLKVMLLDSDSFCEHIQI